MNLNPISYNDPDGDCPNCVTGLWGAAIGGVGNLLYQGYKGNIGSWGDGFAAFGIGAGAGFVTGFTGNYAAGATILNGVAIGAGSALAGDLLLQGGNGLVFNDPYSPKQTLLSIGLGGIGGGLTAYFSPAKGLGPVAPLPDEVLELAPGQTVTLGNQVKDVSTGVSKKIAETGSTFAATVDDPLTVTASRLPFARSSVNGLSLTNPAGSSVALRIPQDYVAIATSNGKGIIYGPQGVSTSNMANAIRVHLNPTSYAPNGYAVFYNSYGQAFNPNTGRTLSKALWHFLIP